MVFLEGELMKLLAAKPLRKAKLMIRAWLVVFTLAPLALGGGPLINMANP